MSRSIWAPDALPSNNALVNVTSQTSVTSATWSTSHSGTSSTGGTAMVVSWTSGTQKIASITGANFGAPWSRLHTITVTGMTVDIWHSEAKFITSGGAPTITFDGTFTGHLARVYLPTAYPAALTGTFESSTGQGTAAVPASITTPTTPDALAVVMGFWFGIGFTTSMTDTGASNTRKWLAQAAAGGGAGSGAATAYGMAHHVVEPDDPATAFGRQWNLTGNATTWVAVGMLLVPVSATLRSTALQASDVRTYKGRDTAVLDLAGAA